jgi:hypothetical protein
MDKSKKVYEVRTALAETEDENELPNWNQYKLVAQDAESAIEIAKGLFTNPVEFVEEVKLITTLDV